MVIDLPIESIERHKLLNGIETLASRWDWSDKLFAIGFAHALSDTLRLDQAWTRIKALGAELGGWCEDAESLLYRLRASVRSDKYCTRVTRKS